MRKILVLVLSLCSVCGSFAQSSFSFRCSRDTTLTCANSCITLKSIIPNIRSFTGSYKVVKTSGPAGCFAPPSRPDLPGVSANLTSDDRYTPLINIPFNFPFYGAAYSKAVISTNGVISFDASNASGTAHYGILASGTTGLSASAGAPVDLPSNRYDNAIIMGAYSDVDPTITTSPTQQIKYETVGTAPHRKWVVSFYKVPCYNTPCHNLIQNTYQMVLYEGLGVIDVFVYSKENCPSWNEGRGIVGIQNFGGTSGLMAPGRAASSGMWGAMNMNESWRFIPSGGAALFRSTELLDLSGNLVATGDTLNRGDGTYDVSFPNVCTNTSTTYIIKTRYAQWNNANGSEFSMDTVRVNISTTAAPITEAVVPAPCGLNTTGTITISSPIGPSVKYSVSDGVNTTVQYSPVITQAPGSYTVTAIDTVTGCQSVKNIIINTQTTLTATALSDSASCVGSSTGRLTVTASLGTAPFTYAIDGGSFTGNNVFSNLNGGQYELTVKDNLGCEYNFTADVYSKSGFTTSATTQNTACLGAATGSITINVPSRGTAPFSYKLDTSAASSFQSANLFTGLAANTYNLVVRDANNCQYNFSASVSPSVGSSATSRSVTAACSGSATGRIIITPTLGTAPFRFSKDSGLTYQTVDSFTNLLPGTYQLAVKDVNGCVYNFTGTVFTGTGSGATPRTVNAACPGSATGRIIITPTRGTAPFLYSRDSGITYQSVDSFTNLLPGTYRLAIRDANGCVFHFLAAVGSGTGSLATSQSVNAACSGSATGRIIITPTRGAAPFLFSRDSGLTYQSVDSFTNLLSGPYRLAVKDANGCVYQFSGTVGNGPGSNAISSSISAACSGSATGRITITPTLGSAPFQFSKDSGLTYQIVDSFTNLLSGPYRLAVKDVYGCVYQFSGTVGNGPGSNAISRSVNAACSGSATGRIIITPTRGTAPFLFSRDSGLTYQSVDSFTNLLSGPYRLAVKDVYGCVYQFSGTVGNDIGATANSSTANAACLGSATGRIFITPVLGTAPFRFSSDSGLNYQLADSFINVLPGGYQLAVKDVNGCTFRFSTTVGNNIGVTASSRSVNSACASASTGKIIVSALTGTAPFRYSLDNISFQNNDTFPNLASGPYTIYVTDANNCAFDFSGTVNNDIGVRATGQSLNAACSGSATGTLLVSATTGTAPFEYLIGTNPPNAYQSSPVFRNLAAGNYDITVRDANRCSYLFNKIVANNIGVRVDTIIDKASCAIVPNGKITIIPTAGIAPFSYQLDSGTPQASNEFASLFSGSFTVTVRDSANCLLSFPVQVGNAARVVIDSVRIVRPTCNGLANGRISIFPRLGVPPYKYSINGSPFQDANVFEGRTASSGDLIQIRDNSGCIKDTTIVITEPDLLVLATTPVRATCTGNADGSIKANANGGTLPYTYTLDPDGNTGFQTNPVFPLVIGSYTVTVRDAMGCKSTATESVLLNDTMRLELGPDTTLCIGKSMTFNVQTNNETTRFTWKPSAYLNDSLFKNPTASPRDTIRYYLEARWGICTRIDSITINVLLKPTAYAGKDTAVCFNTPALLRGTAGKVSGPVTYLWAPPTFLERTDTTVTTCRPDTTGSYRYFLTVRDNYGCGFITTDSVLVTMQPLVPAFAGNDTNALANGPHQLYATGGVRYSWWPTGPLNNPDIANPLATVRLNTTFIVTVTDEAGCIGTDSVLLRAYVGPTYHCPNAFSPNGDGLNERFRPLPVGIRSTQYFRIFNRYGEPVFETNAWEGQFLKGWDGTFRGKLMDAGTYVWVIKGIDEKGKEVQQKGTVVLIR